VGSGQDLTIMVVEHPSLAAILKTAFDATWDRGMTLEEAEKQHSATRPPAA
jgi:hypothetical protein